jgi:glycosyltransferase involved in cell wall biosynthesis
MKITVILPAFNEEKLIASALRAVGSSLEAFTAAGWQTEVIVCDNASTDATATIARRAGARVVHEPFNQIARARNRGAAAADGDWLMFVDADSFPTQTLFEQVRETIECGKFVGGGALVTLAGIRGFPWLIAQFWNGLSYTARWMAGSFIFCETPVFRELGGFNETLFASEEIDFSRRLKRWARRNRRKIRIIGWPRLRTSGRKIQLCSPGEYARLLWDTAQTWGGNLRQRDACRIWYDGRR